MPEVRALAEQVATHATGHTLVRADVLSVQVLKTFDPPVSALDGCLVTGTATYGKFLAVRAEGTRGAGPVGVLHLVLHLARAGWIRHRESLPARQSAGGGRGPVALRLVLDDGSGFDITEPGSTKRLAAYLVRDPHEVPGVAHLGDDPLADTFTLARLADLATGSQNRLKAFLTDQRIMAGIGNAYSDEILHAARLSPYATARTLDEAKLARLHSAMREVLAGAVMRARGVAAQNLKAEKKAGLRVHGRTGDACPVCQDTIRSVFFADSSLQYCPTCQTGGRRLADRRLSRLLK